MGLDSVELVMEIEKYFNIRIPDQEAEKIFTVEDMVRIVANYLSISNSDLSLRDSIIKKINDALFKLNFTDHQLSLSDFIFLILNPLEKEKWRLFENNLGLRVPKPTIIKGTNENLLNKIKSAFTWNPLYDWKQITLEQFTTAICSKNCDLLINPASIKSTYEIYVAVMRITVDKIGIDEYDITPEKSFTNDLGVD